MIWSKNTLNYNGSKFIIKKRLLGSIYFGKVNGDWRMTKEDERKKKQAERRQKAQARGQKPRK
jgi:hypothetical protein